MADYGLKVSQPGFDVKTATNIQLGFSSAFNSYKISSQGSGSITIPANTGSQVTIAHGLSYVPSFIGFYQSNPNSNIWTQTCANVSPSSFDIWCNYFYADTTNIYIGLQNQTAGSLVVSYYYIIYIDVGA